MFTDSNKKCLVKALGKENMKKSHKQIRRNFRRKNSLYIFEDDVTNEDSVSNECCSEDEREVNLFMAQGELDKEHMTSDDEE